MKEGIFWLITLLAISGNIIWYWIKSVLKQNQYKVNYFYGHVTDLVNFSKLIEDEKNPKLKSRYTKVFFY